MAHSFDLQPSAADGISKLTFMPRRDEAILVASSWDKNLYVYDVAKQRLVHQFDAGTAVLSCTSKHDQAGFLFCRIGWQHQKVWVNCS